MNNCVNEKKTDLSKDIQDSQKLLPVIEELEPLLKALADKNRLKIVSILARKEHCVCELMVITGLSQNLISHHLATLKKADLASCRRQGKWIYYLMTAGNKQKLTRILQLIS